MLVKIAGWTSVRFAALQHALPYRAHNNLISVSILVRAKASLTKLLQCQGDVYPSSLLHVTNFPKCQYLSDMIL